MSSMASQYTSPRLPLVPNSTPVRGSANLRAPINNPYDKFTRQEFDAWIGDLTSTIRRVLTHDDDLPPSARGSVRYGDTSVFEDDDVAPEDSFAEVKARRAAKGKARAVELDESAEEEYVKSIILDEVHEDEEASEEEEAEEEDDGEAEYDSENNDDGPEYSSSPNRTQQEPETIEISSDEEEDEPRAHRPIDEDANVEHPSEEEHSEDDHSTAPRRTVNVAEEENDEQSEEEGDEEDFPPKQTVRETSIEVPDPWAGPSTYAEDFYSGGDVPEYALHSGNPDLLPGEYDEDFPPAPTPKQPIELSDPWSGPRMYAEDFYSGGDIRGDPSELTPSHLTPALTPRSEEDVGMVLTPGVSTPTPPPSHIVHELRDEDDVEHQEQSDDVPTFSMPASRDDDDAVDTEEGEGEQHTGLHSRSASPLRTSVSGHVDWNYPPAFPAGRAATAPGHLISPHLDSEGRAESPEILVISDDDDEDIASPVPKMTVPIHLETHGHDEDEVSSHSDEAEHLADIPIPMMSTPPSSSRQLFESTPSPPRQYYGDLELETYLASASAFSQAGEEHFEPVYGQDLDFGALPSSSDAAHDHVEEPGLLGVFGPIEDPGLQSGEREHGGLVSDTETPAAPAPERTVRFSDVIELVSGGVEVEETKTVRFSDVIELVDEEEPAAAVMAVATTEDAVNGPTPEVKDTPDAEPNAAALSHDEPPTGSSTFAQESKVAAEPPVKDAEATVVEKPHASEPAVPTIHISASTAPPEQPSISAADADKTTAATHDHTPVPMFDPSSGVPMPVSADPSVPDPASVHDTPVSAGSPASPDSALASPASPASPGLTSPTSPNRERSGLASAIPPGLFGHLSGHKSFSGLFTPMSEGNSSPAGSAEGDDAEGEGEGEEEEVDELAEEGGEEPAAGLAKESAADSAVGVAAEVEVVVEATADIVTAETSLPPPSTETVEAEAEAVVVEGVVQPDEPTEIVEEATATELDHSEAAAEPTEPSLEVPTEPGTHTDEAEDMDQIVDMDLDADGEIDLDYHPNGNIEHGEPAHLHEDEQDAKGVAKDGETLPLELTSPAEESVSPLSSAPEATSDATEQTKAALEASIPTELERGAETDEPAVTDEQDKPNTSQISEPAVESDAPKDGVVAGVEASQPAADDKEHDSNVSPGTHLSDAPVEEPRPLKRKRRERTPQPVPGPVRMTRSMSSRSEKAEHTIAVKALPKSRKGKGKRKALEPTSEEEEHEAVAEQRSSPVATSSEIQGDPSSEKEPSRESSVLSSVLGYGEASSSPLTLSPVIEAHEIERAPPLLTNGTLQHIHGHGRSATMPELAQLHRRSEPVAPPPPPPPPIVLAEPVIPTPPEPPVPSTEDVPSPAGTIKETPVETITERSVETTLGIPAETTAETTAATTAETTAETITVAPVETAPTTVPSPPAETVSTLAPSPPAEVKPAEPSSTSPVTRSNCRFHKISLPVREGGARVFFAVPGCSLSDRELMEEEHIEDHGDAIVDDVKHLVRDIKSLEVYNSYLEGVLRQLLGVDLLREQEIYYMIQPGEVPRYRPVKTSTYRPRESFSGQPSSSQRSARISHRSKAPKRASTPSESISSSASVEHKSTRRSVSISASASVSDGEEDGDEGQPKAKRRRPMDAIADEPEPETPVAGPSEAGSKPRARKSKRLPTEAAAYKPDGSSEKSESDDEEVGRAGRRRLRPRKRARGEEEAEQKTAAATRAKRRKVALPTADTPAEDEAAEAAEAT